MMAANKQKKRFDRQVSRLVRQLPRPLAAVIVWLRKPYARLVRIPLGIVFVIGGAFSILPVLGLWMLPLGLLLLAVDLPILQGPVGRLLVRLQRWNNNRRAKSSARR